MGWRRRILIAVLAAGVVGGYGIEIARWRGHHRYECASYGRAESASGEATRGDAWAHPEPKRTPPPADDEP